MTPKEKAIELFEKMAFSCRECDYESNAKQCALIAVDEILHITSKRVSWFNVRGMYKERFVLDQYWVEVKQEIEKL
jgi:hypothetical protein